MARVLILLALVSVIAGCGTMRPQQAAAEDLPSESLVESDASAKVLYHLLAGEIAAKRNQLERAAEYYAEAAGESERVDIAERATRVALYADHPGLAERSARRWLELDPDAVNAKRMLGLVALRRGDTARATEWFRDSLPESGAAREEALAGMGALLGRQDDQAAALVVAESLAEAFSDSRMAQFVEGRLALRAGHAEQAVVASDRALAIDESWRAARVLRVEAMLEQGRTEAALGSFRSLLEDSPDDFDLRLQYARTLMSVERRDQALQQFERLLERRPEDSRALLAGGILALQQDRLDTAQGWFERLLATGERNDEARYYLGRIAEMRERYAEAIDYYSAAGGSYRDEAALRIAFALAANGQVSEARERLAQLREDRPESAVRAWLVEGELLRQQDRLEDSLSVFNEALEAHPEAADLLYGRAMTRVLMDRIDAAETDFRAVLEQEPENAHALNALGYTLVDRTDRIAEGAELVERAYSLQPDDAAIIDSMGWVAYRQGRLEEALGYLRDAHERSPGGEIAAHLGEVLWELGRRDEAREVWNRALARFPDSDVLRRTMERFLE